LIAELLLKRTTATSAARTYGPFLSQYPTLAHLASATEEGLARDLAPVGLYNQRAKALLKLAKYLMGHEAEALPSSLDRLLKVPGLGDYSARAILSFGYGVPAAVLDANVARILSRVFQASLPPRPTQSLLQALADVLMPEDSHQQYNFGLLDLGALVCRYVDPGCAACDLNTICDYYQGDNRRGKWDVRSRLREMRLTKQMSLVALSKLTGVSKLTIINIEAGRTRPREETIKRLAFGLGVPPEDLSSDQQPGSP
jgi:A/G-specific adenine glycosylase